MNVNEKPKLFEYTTTDHIKESIELCNINQIDLREFISNPHYYNKDKKYVKGEKDEEDFMSIFVKGILISHVGGKYHHEFKYEVDENGNMQTISPPIPGNIRTERCTLRKTFATFIDSRHPLRKYIIDMLKYHAVIEDKVVDIEKLRERSLAKSQKIKQLNNQLDSQGNIRLGVSGKQKLEDYIKSLPTNEQEWFQKLEENDQKHIAKQNGMAITIERKDQEINNLRLSNSECQMGNSETLSKATDYIEGMNSEKVNTLKQKKEKEKEKEKNIKLQCESRIDKNEIKELKNEIKGLKKVKQSSGNNSYWEENCKDLEKEVELKNEEVQRKNKKILKLEALLKRV